MRTSTEYVLFCFVLINSAQITVVLTWRTTYQKKFAHFAGSSCAHHTVQSFGIIRKANNIEKLIIMIIQRSQSFALLINK